MTSERAGPRARLGDAPPLRQIAGATFGALTSLRGRRLFHPTGVAYEARVCVDEASLAAALGGVGAGWLRAIVRFSRGAGIPEPLPDVLGLAMKLPDVHGPGADQDFLLVTSGDGPLLDRLLLPAQDFLAMGYSSVLPYRVGGEQVLIGARAGGSDRAGRFEELDALAARDGLRFELATAPLLGDWKAVGRLEVGRRLDPQTAESLRFNPWNTGPGIEPTGILNGMRRAAYRASQLARSA